MVRKWVSQMVPLISYLSDLLRFKLHALFCSPPKPNNIIWEVQGMWGFTKPSRILVTGNSTETCTHQSCGLVVAPLNYWLWVKTFFTLLNICSTHSSSAFPETLSSYIDFFFLSTFSSFPSFIPLWSGSPKPQNTTKGTPTFLGDPPVWSHWGSNSERPHAWLRAPQLPSWDSK